MLTIRPLEWLVETHIIFDRNTGRKTSKIKWLFESNLISSILKSLQGLGSTRFTPGLQLKRQLNYTKCLIPDIAKNRALKKRKLNSNPRYGPDTTSSWMHKQLCSINKQENYSKALHYKTLEQHKNLLISQQIINEGLTFQKTPSFLWSSNNILNG